MLEEAREDEIARAALETQLEHTEQLLVTERAKSAMLHSQLATSVTTTHFLENGYTNATVCFSAVNSNFSYAVPSDDKCLPSFHGEVEVWTNKSERVYSGKSGEQDGQAGDDNGGRQSGRGRNRVAG